MRWILFQQRKVLIRQFAHCRRQLAIACPERRCGKVVHRGVQRPALKSSSAFMPAGSKRPAATSASMRRSHSSAKNSSNQRANVSISSGANRATACSSSCTLMGEYYHRFPRMYAETLIRRDRGSHLQLSQRFVHFGMNFYETNTSRGQIILGAFFDSSQTLGPGLSAFFPPTLPPHPAPPSSCFRWP